MKPINFINDAAKAEWETALENADAGQSVLMVLAADWAHNIEHDYTFRSIYTPYEIRRDFVDIFKITWSHDNDARVMLACVQLLITHRWVHGRELFIAFQEIYYFQPPVALTAAHR